MSNWWFMLILVILLVLFNTVVAAISMKNNEEIAQRVQALESENDNLNGTREVIQKQLNRTVDRIAEKFRALDLLMASDRVVTQGV